MNIRDFITAYLKDRDMTMVEFTEKLGYRSKTSVVRIMNGDISLKSFEAFLNRLRSFGDLSEAENEKLREASDVQHWQGDYFPSREMLNLLQGEICKDGLVLLDCVNNSMGEIAIPDAPRMFDNTFDGATDIDIILMNSQYVPIFEKLKSLIENQGARVRHYMMVNDDMARTIHAVNVVFPIMFMANYSGYLLNKTDQSGHNGLQAADYILANWTNAKGVRCEAFALFDSPNHGRMYYSSRPGTLAKLLAIPIEKYMPIRHSNYDNGQMKGYVEFCNERAEIERNCRLFAIKPDPCLECIPTEIVFAAAQEGPFGQNEEFQQMADVFFSIFAARYKNTFERRKAHHTIMKRSAFWKFVRTGRLSDNFWGLRPFTLKERAAIIRNLIAQEENNPFFHIYFLKDNQYIRDMEFFCFEGKGILMINATTDYDLDQGHAEIMVDHPEFQRLFKEFFLKHLIRYQVISASETRKFLLSQLEYCEDPNSPEFSAL